MQVAFTAAIIEVVPFVPAAVGLREAEFTTRLRAKNWAVPSTIDRGRLIDLVV